MASSSPKGRKQLTPKDLHRSGWSLGMPLFGMVAIGSFGVAWVVLTLNTGRAGEYLPWAAGAFAIVAYLAWLARCSVDADPARPVLVVRNRLRTWVIPWADVLDVTHLESRLKGNRGPLHYVVVVRTAEGAAVRCDGLRAGSFRRVLDLCGALWRLRVDAVGPVNGEAVTGGTTVAPPWARI